MTRLLHIAARAANTAIWNDVFRRALGDIGDLTVLENGADMTDEQRAALIREADILVTSWGAAKVPEEVAKDPGRLRYICHVTGELKNTIPLAVVEAGIPVTNWGSAPAEGVAEGAMALLMATLKDLHHQIMTVRRGGWQMDMHTRGGTLRGRSVGVYGFGVIGRRFVELLRPFGSVIRVFDPYASGVPDDCIRVDSLDDLCRLSEILVIHAGLTDETRHSVDARRLAMLPRHGVVVNTARGGIIDQDALFAELESGRLRAGLDVTVPEPLPEDHPARQWENLILTGHRIENAWPDFNEPPTELSDIQAIAADNIRRFLAGEPLRFVMDRNRYLRST